MCAEAGATRTFGCLWPILSTASNAHQAEFIASLCKQGITQRVTLVITQNVTLIYIRDCATLSTAVCCLLHQEQKKQSFSPTHPPPPPPCLSCLAQLHDHQLSKMCIQDAVRTLKARLTDATAALQISHSEALRLRTRVADLKAAVSVSSHCAPSSVIAWHCSRHT